MVNQVKARRPFDELSVFYHTAFKKILEFSRYNSNHLAHYLLNSALFEYFINLIDLQILQSN